jgi:hypothetical protein
MSSNQANYYPEYNKYLPGKLKKNSENDTIILQKSSDASLDCVCVHEYFESIEKSKIHRYFVSFNNKS